MTALSQLLTVEEDQRPVLKVALGYLVAITTAEVLTAYIEPRVGLWLHGILLVGLLLHATMAGEQPMYRVLLTLSFAPLIRMVSLSLPLVGFPLIYWYFITSVPLFVASLIAARTLGFSWDSIGINRRSLLLQLVVGLSGLAFGYLEYRILAPRPLARAFTWEAIWLPALILMVSTGLLEELIFRGLMQQATQVSLGRLGVPYVSALFAVLHMGYKSLLDVAFVFVVALFFGYVAERTESIVGVSLSHGVTNIVLFLVAPFVF
jgi:membrane protease YdiL (CAAX protease family)